MQDKIWVVFDDECEVVIDHQVDEVEDHHQCDDFNLTQTAK
jgi:hypothetical protein